MLFIIFSVHDWHTLHFDRCGLDLRHFVTCSCCCFCRLQMYQEFFCIQICVSFLFENLIFKWVKREAYVVWRSLLVLVFTERQNNQFSQKKLVIWTKNLVCHHWYKVGMCVDHINSSLDMLINFCTICWPEDRLYWQDKPWKSFRIWILDLFNFSFISWSFGISNVPVSNLVLWNFVP